MFILKIKKVREMRRLTQDELSKKSGVDQSYISRLEKEERHRSPTLHIIEQLAEILEICPKKLLECNCKYCKNERKNQKGI